MTAYCFDVDGTLTPSRGAIDPAFKEYFLRFQRRHETYIVTGSDYAKSLEQLGPEILQEARLVFSCCGNEIRQGHDIIYSSNWQPSMELLDYLTTLLDSSKYPVKTGRHIEVRTGLLNFSIVGRNADQQQRRDYYEYDCKSGERDSLSLRIQAAFPDIEVGVAGETGMDIYPWGANKSQVLQHIHTRPLTFFGDKTKPGGNDYPLAAQCDLTHHVENWQHTWELLEMINS